MRYEARLQRLEQEATSIGDPVRVISYIVDPHGIFEALDEQTGTRFKRDNAESESDFKARVKRS